MLAHSSELVESLLVRTGMAVWVSEDEGKACDMGSADKEEEVGTEIEGRKLD